MTKKSKLNIASISLATMLVCSCLCSCVGDSYAGNKIADKKSKLFNAFFIEWLENKDVDQLLAWFSPSIINKVGETKMRRDAQALADFIEGDFLCRSMYKKSAISEEISYFTEIKYLTNSFYFATTQKTYYLAYEDYYYHSNCEEGIFRMYLTEIESDLIPEEYEKGDQFLTQQIVYGWKFDYGITTYKCADVLDYLNNGGEL